MDHLKKFEEFSFDENENANSQNSSTPAVPRFKGQFPKGHVPFNIGKKREEYLDQATIDKMRETEFKEGETTGEAHPSWKGGIQASKRDGKFINTGTNERKRIARYNYEKAHGEIPKGWIIYHLDKDKENDEVDNLIAVPRAILMTLNSNRMNSNYHEIQTAIDIYLAGVEKRK